MPCLHVQHYLNIHHFFTTMLRTSTENIPLRIPKANSNKKKNNKFTRNPPCRALIRSNNSSCVKTFNRRLGCAEERARTSGGKEKERLADYELDWLWRANRQVARGHTIKAKILGGFEQKIRRYRLLVSILWANWAFFSVALELRATLACLAARRLLAIVSTEFVVFDNCLLFEGKRNLDNFVARISRYYVNTRVFNEWLKKVLFHRLWSE